MKTPLHAGRADRTGRTGRWLWSLGYLGLAAVLALGFWGYQSPAIALAWEALVALCGF